MPTSAARGRAAGPDREPRRLLHRHERRGILTSLDYADLISLHRESGNVFTVASHRRTVRSDYGVLRLDGEAGKTRVVTGFEEEPETHHVVSMGVYAMEPRALDVHRPRRPPRLSRPRPAPGRGRRAGRFLPLRRLLAGHRPPRRLRTGDRGVRRNQTDADAGRLSRAFERKPLSMRVAITGGAGYIGALLARSCASTATTCGALDSLFHGQEDVAARRLSRRGVEVIRGDVRDADARAAGARRGRRGRPPGGDRRRPGVRARPGAVPTRSTSRPRERSSPTPQAAGVQRLVFASTCSNYGRMADPTVPITESGELRPVSLYAEQKVGDRAAGSSGRPADGLAADLPALRHRLRGRAAHALRPDGQRVHPRPLGRPRRSKCSASSSGGPTSTCATRRGPSARCSTRRWTTSPARCSTPAAPTRTTASSTSSEMIRERIGRGEVEYVHRDEDPRDYKVCFEKISGSWASSRGCASRTESTRSSPPSRSSASATPSQARYRTSAMSAGDSQPIPLFDIDLEAGHRGGRRDAALGLADDGPAGSEAFEEAFAEHLGARHAIAISSCTAALHLAYLAAGIGPGDEVIVPAITFVARPRPCATAAPPRSSPTRRAARPRPRPRRRRGRGSRLARRRSARSTTPDTPPTSTALRELCDRHGLALIEDAAHAPSAKPKGGGRKLGTYGLAGCFSFFSNKVLSVRRGRPAGDRRRRGRGARPLAPLARDDLGDLGPPPRPLRRLRRSRPRLQLPHRRAAGGAAALPAAPPGGRTSSDGAAWSTATARRWRASQG